MIFLGVCSGLVLMVDVVEVAAADENALDRKSHMGIFIRRMILGFNQMLFHGLVQLWDKFVQYKDLMDGSYSGSISPYQCDSFVNEEIDSLTSLVFLLFLMVESIGKLSQSEIQDRIDRILFLAPYMTKCYFLRYILMVC